MAKDPRSVFVVHGRNAPLRNAMFDFLRAIGLRPMEWTQAVALTADGSPYIGQVLDAAFEHAQAVVVLLTPDEITYLRPEIAGSPNDPDSQPAPQARPNVLFEAGMAFGHNPKHTVLVEIGSLRAFSDVGGRHTVRLSNDAKDRQALVKRLDSAGCDIDASGTDWLTVGDFTPPPEPGGGRPLGRRVPSVAHARPPLDFALRYFDRGSNKLGKLQVINRGGETAYSVNLSLPENAALELTRAVLPVAKIPGNGQSVTLDVFSQRHYFRGSESLVAFDVTVTGRTESGEEVSQDVFIDLNG